MRVRERICFSVLALLLCGCRVQHEGVESGVVSMHKIAAEHVVRDSVFVCDSVFVRDKSDTVFFTKYRTLYKERIVRDTLFVCDTLYKERVVKEYVKSDTQSKGRGCLWLLMLLPFTFPGFINRLIKIVQKCIRFFHSKE